MGLPGERRGRSVKGLYLSDKLLTFYESVHMGVLWANLSALGW